MTAAALAALLPFYLSRRAKRNRKFNNLQEVEKYFYGLVDNVFNKAQEQIKDIKAALLLLNHKDTPDVILKYQEGFLFNKIDNISDDLFKIFVKGKSSEIESNEKLLIGIFIKLDSIESVINGLRPKLDEFTNLYNKHIKEWNTGYEKLRSLYEKDLIKAKEGKLKDKKLLAMATKLNSIVFKWQKLTAPNIITTHKELVVPLHQLSKNHDELKYMDELLRCMGAFKHIVDLTNACDKQFNMFIDSLNKHSYELQDKSIKLKAIPFRNPKLWIDF